jgi:hypothetical protein
MTPMKDYEDGPIVRRKKKTGHTKPPVIGGFSTKNSHTSPKRIAQRRKEALALQLREQGYSHAQIAAHMKLSPSRVCRMIFSAMDKLIPVESAERVRVLEMRRLDAIQSEIWEDVINGNLGAIHAYLRLSDQRSRLMGLYPKDGQQVTVGLPGNNVDEIQITFVPGPRQRGEVVDVTPPAPAPYQNAQPDLSRPAIAPPPERRRGPLGLWTEEKPTGTSWMK